VVVVLLQLEEEEEVLSLPLVPVVWVRVWPDLPGDLDLSSCNQGRKVLPSLRVWPDLLSELPQLPKRVGAGEALSQAPLPQQHPVLALVPIPSWPLKAYLGREDLR
jgi:hypothetical protein